MTVVWLTGTPCAGKSTIAIELQKKLGEENAVIFDGDKIRTELDLKPGPEAREENLARVLAAMQASLVSKPYVIAAIVSPVAKLRQVARESLEEGGARFLEVFVKASAEVCSERDVKGLYGRAIAGESISLPGFNAPYEVPEKPDLVCRTEKATVEESGAAILAFLAARA